MKYKSYLIVLHGNLGFRSSTIPNQQVQGVELRRVFLFRYRDIFLDLLNNLSGKVDAFDFTQKNICHL